MNITEVAVLADRLLVEHGYGRVPFLVADDMLPYRRAETRFIPMPAGAIPIKVLFNSHWIPVLTDDEIKEVILHEIAHLIAGYEADHDEPWQEACISLGIAPVAESRSGEIPQILVDYILGPELGEVARKKDYALRG